MAGIARRGWRRRLAERFGVGGDALYILVAGSVAILISGLAAHSLRQPLLLPSLGPTVFLIFEKPLAAESSPRNTLIGHGVGIAVGFGALSLFGLRGAPSALLLLLDAAHPPASTSTLIVSLGLLATPGRLLAMAAGVLLTVTAWLINRALGVPVHPWREPAAARGQQAGVRGRADSDEGRGKEMIILRHEIGYTYRPLKNGLMRCSISPLRFRQGAVRHDGDQAARLHPAHECLPR